MVRVLGFIVAFFGALFWSTQVAAKGETLIIGTGGVSGVYYPSGGAICKLVNKARSRHNLRCAVAATEGSLYNLEQLQNDHFDLVIVQSDWHFHAYKGTDRFADTGPLNEIRSLFSLHAEPFTVVVRNGIKARKFTELKGLRVNVGNQGSGQRATVEVLMRELNWDMSVFSEVHEIPASRQAKALCENKIDAMVYTVGHPNSSIREAVEKCQAKIISVDNKAVDRLVRDFPFYGVVTIPKGTYPGVDRDIVTFGVRATVVAKQTLPSDAAYQLVRSVFEELPTLKRLHPALGLLIETDMVEKNLTAPLHVGAKQYYREAGLLP